MKKRKGLKIVLGLLMAFLLVITAVSNYLFEYAVARRGDGGDRKVKTTQIQPDKTSLKAMKGKKKEEAKAYFEKQGLQEDKMTSYDGTQLKLFYVENPSVSKWVLMIHGYRSKHEEMLAYAKLYHKQGYNVVMPDLRASGQSEGSYVGMGMLDKEDMKFVLQWIIRRHRNAAIVVHGNSMGAATALLLAGEKEASQVKAFVADSAYTSVYEMFKEELQLRFHLPSFPLLDVASLISKMRAGYSFKEVSVIQAIKRSTKPILLIHGEKDDFVPFSMMQRLYDAKTQGKKKQLVSKKAGHTESLFDLGDVYSKTIFDFIRSLDNADAL